MQRDTLEQALFETLNIRFDQIDARITQWMANYGLTLLRVSVGIVFFWFGALKLMPGLSPAEGLIRESLPFLPMGLFIPFLGLWEMAIGLGYISGRFMRITILLMMFQMLGAASPLVLNPEAVWNAFPFALTLEGQYIIKNTVLISAAMVIGGTVRGGKLIADPDAPKEQA
ncbi:MAG: DoxX family protein [Chloroflexi bacterium]|nr:DoxX family protein [Chloroflexota bacterium]